MINYISPVLLGTRLVAYSRPPCEVDAAEREVVGLAVPPTVYLF